MGAQNLAINIGKKTSVMLVDDSAVVRGMVRKWLETIDNIEVVDSADNGKVAINKVAKEKPDIIILDIEMPVMDGITALPELLRKAPKAIVLIASTLSLKNAEISLRAMSLGASDYIPKPSFARDGNEAREAFKSELIRKIIGLMPKTSPVKSYSSSNVSTTKNAAWSPMPKANDSFNFRKASLINPRALAIGSSTGGPAALSKVFEQLKGKLSDIPVFVVQHMPPTFTTLLGERLAKTAGIEGGEAKADEPVVAGRLYLAPGGFHMRVAEINGTKIIKLDKGPPINHCRPAVDPMFESIAEQYGNATLAAVLTGMGSDGANGAVAIAHTGGTIFAQDEASSVVWGMPGATALAGVCTKLVDIEKMADELARMINKGMLR